MSAKRPTDKETAATKPCWLVWTLLASGQTVLRAVCSTEKTAKHYEEYCLKALGVERAMVERSRMNHLYFGAFNDGPPAPGVIKAALSRARAAMRAESRRKP